MSLVDLLYLSLDATTNDCFRMKESEIVYNLDYVNNLRIPSDFLRYLSHNIMIIWKQNFLRFLKLPCFLDCNRQDWFSIKELFGKCSQNAIVRIVSYTISESIDQFWNFHSHNVTFTVWLSSEVFSWETYIKICF